MLNEISNRLVMFPRLKKMSYHFSFFSNSFNSRTFDQIVSLASFGHSGLVGRFWRTIGRVHVCRLPDEPISQSFIQTCRTQSFRSLCPTHESFSHCSSQFRFVSAKERLVLAPRSSHSDTIRQNISKNQEDETGKTKDGKLCVCVCVCVSYLKHFLAAELTFSL